MAAIPFEDRTIMTEKEKKPKVVRVTTSGVRIIECEGKHGPSGFTIHEEDRVHRWVRPETNGHGEGP